MITGGFYEDQEFGIWDGLTDQKTKTSVGTYIGVFEAFSIQGGLVFAKRKAFVVAGKL